MLAEKQSKDGEKSKGGERLYAGYRSGADKSFTDQYVAPWHEVRIAIAKTNIVRQAGGEGYATGSTYSTV